MCGIINGDATTVSVEVAELRFLDPENNIATKPKLRNDEKQKLNVKMQK